MAQHQAIARRRALDSRNKISVSSSWEPNLLVRRGRWNVDVKRKLEMVSLAVVGFEPLRPLTTAARAVEVVGSIAIKGVNIQF